MKGNFIKVLVIVGLIVFTTACEQPVIETKISDINAYLKENPGTEYVLIKTKVSDIKAYLEKNTDAKSKSEDVMLCKYVVIGGSVVVICDPPDDWHVINEDM